MECQTIMELRMLDRSIHKQYEQSPSAKALDSLTGLHCWIIGYLADHEAEDIYQRDLEKEFGTCRSAISRMLAAMEKNGLVERERVAADDRLKKIVLTPLAKQFTEQIRADSRILEQTLTHGFTETELQTLHGFLQRMQANLMNRSGKETT